MYRDGMCASPGAFSQKSAPLSFGLIGSNVSSGHGHGKANAMSRNSGRNNPAISTI